ncbi:MAG: ABC transporter ATP-binding protein [Dehalococcoidales bacterium]|nr:ABC transporter ATP-binding protein [Dehalococcoidales bacterium]
MIKFTDVTRDYRLDEETVVTPVNNINLDIKGGEFILIIGRSGSGKTTLLNLAAGLIKPTRGKVFIGGIDLWGMTDEQLASFRNQKIGFSFQFPSLLPSLTAVQNVIVPTLFAAKDKRDGVQKRATDILGMLGLGEKVNVYPKQLSAGEQKRVVIARALINHPGLLLADEPTSDLDAQTEQEIMSLFRSIQASGITIMMVTHSLELIPYATRAFRMENGHLKDVAEKDAQSPAGQLLNYNVRYIYGS